MEPTEPTEPTGTPEPSDPLPVETPPANELTLDPSTTPEAGTLITEGGTTEDGYQVHYDGYTIHNIKYGALTLSKKLEGGDTEAEREFTFVVTLTGVDGSRLSGEYKVISPDTTEETVTFTNGTAEFTLKGGESVIIQEIPAGTAYTVTETEANQDGYTTTVPNNANGTIPVGETGVVVVFINRRDPGSLTITKRVSGSGADYGGDFRFQVTLTDPDGRPLTGDYSVTIDGGETVAFKNGVAEFALKNGQSATVSQLPTGTHYQVEELDADGYTVTVTPAEGAEGSISADTHARVTFQNHKGSGGEGVGNLTVAKTVTGTRGDREKDFHFTVTLDNESISGTYGDMTFRDGVAEFTLRHGASVTATGLPSGVGYTVTEEEAGEDGYTTTADNDTGSIPENSTASVGFTNHKGGSGGGGEDDDGDLTIEKTVTGQGDRTRDFTFTVTLTDAGGRELTGRYRYTGDKSGTLSSGGHITLRHGESVTIRDLPVGTRYQVVEEEADQDGYRTTADGDTGRITTGTAYASFRNALSDPGEPDEPDVPDVPDTPDEPDQPDEPDVPDEPDQPDEPDEPDDPGEPVTGALVVSKTVAGSAGETDRAFTFTVTLNDPSINGTYGEMTFADGVAVFTLRHGETRTAQGLPAGTGYRVTEAEADQDGYDTTATGAAGTIPEGTAQAQFHNQRDTSDDTPETGDPGRTGLWVALALASLGGLCLLWATRPGGRGKRLKK